MNCPSCGQELPKESIVDKAERRMKEYSDWIWAKLENPALPLLPWDVKNRKYATYGDVVKK
jgi:hypothetical protein